MTEKQFCSTLEELVQYMKSNQPNSTTLNITSCKNGYICFTFEDWDKPQDDMTDFKNVKRRHDREGHRFEDGAWHINNGDQMNQYYQSIDLLKEVG